MRRLRAKFTDERWKAAQPKDWDAPKDSHPQLCDSCKQTATAAAARPAAGTRERQEPVRNEAAPDDFWEEPQRPICTWCGAAFTDERWKATKRVGWTASPAKRPSLCGDCDQRFETDLDRAWGVSPRREKRDQEQEPAVPEQKTGWLSPAPLSRARLPTSRASPSGRDQPGQLDGNGGEGTSCWKRLMRGGRVRRGQTETLDEKHQRLLEAFVLRARRVEEHSLAADWDALVELTRMSINVRIDRGEVRISYELPPEEVVESAAARIRPILLEQEDCFHMKALSALGYTCRAEPQDAAWIRAARAEWRTRVSPATRDESGYWVMVTDISTGEERDLDAHGLAMAWIYGDVVHHDPERRKEGDTFGLRDRFRAAVPLVAWAMVGTIELLNFVRALNEAGMLNLRQEVFDEQVALKTTTWEERAEMYYAPVGSQPPSLASSPMPEGWLPLSKASDMSVFRHRVAGQLLNTESAPSMTYLPSPEEVEAARTPAGGWKRDQLAAWGVSWPPPKGWKDELAERWKAARPAEPPAPPPTPAPADFAQDTLDFG